MWNLKTYCVISGASQGIGREIALQFAQKFGSGSEIVLLARSESGLNKTKEMILAINANMIVNVFPIDLTLCDVNQLKTIIEETHANKDYDNYIIVHNVGSVGDVSEFTSHMLDANKWRSYLDLNLISVTLLNSIFLQNVKEVKPCFVINITSLCGIKPFKSMSYYCVGKAGREMFFKVLAEENSQLNVLNYSPGPVQTGMIDNITENLGDGEMKKYFQDMKQSGSYLTTKQTTDRLIQVLTEQKYKSGDHIDYFDKDT